MIEIISYNEKYKEDFKKINLEWLDKYELTESHDLEVLEEPEKYVLDPGGCLFLARAGDRIVGSAGLYKMNNEEFELVKMSVDPEFRGRGIGKILLDRCLEEARKIKAKRVVLFSSSKLQTAIKLYEKYGFQHVAVTNAPFLTADIKMELTI